MASDDFYTIKGYTIHSEGNVTSAMEDYLEMIARISFAGGRARVKGLSAKLHVKASSVTKMVSQLAKENLVNAHRSGEVELTETGKQLGEYLLYRHDVLHDFYRLLNGTENELEQVEKTEHFFNERTIRNL